MHKLTVSLWVGVCHQYVDVGGLDGFRLIVRPLDFFLSFGSWFGEKLVMVI